MQEGGHDPLGELSDGPKGRQEGEVVRDNRKLLKWAMTAPMEELDALVLSLGVVRATRVAQTKPAVVKPVAVKAAATPEPLAI